MSNIQDTLDERGKRYGDFTDHARISQSILDAYMNAPKWDALSDDKKQAMRMFADKAARILNGDPEYKDNWHDIAGYAKLTEDRCAEPVEEVEVGTPLRKCCLTPVGAVHLANCTMGDIRICCPTRSGFPHHQNCTRN